MADGLAIGLTIKVSLGVGVHIYDLTDCSNRGGDGCDGDGDISGDCRRNELASCTTTAVCRAARLFCWNDVITSVSHRRCNSALYDSLSLSLLISLAPASLGPLLATWTRVASWPSSALRMR